MRNSLCEGQDRWLGMAMRKSESGSACGLVGVYVWEQEQVGAAEQQDARAAGAVSDYARF